MREDVSEIQIRIEQTAVFSADADTDAAPKLARKTLEKVVSDEYIQGDEAGFRPRIVAFIGRSEVIPDVVVGDFSEEHTRFDEERERVGVHREMRR